MKQTYEPSPDFVAKVMRRVHALEDRKAVTMERLLWWRPLRYVLAGGGTVVGLLKAVPVF